MPTITCHTKQIDGLNIFYREAGSIDAPVLLLLHGFPSSSHMFRNLIPLLAQNYRVVAPDMPGFGLSSMPTHDDFNYSFEKITDVIEHFTEILEINKFSMYAFDYGAPIGFRLALRHPERIQAIISKSVMLTLKGLVTDGILLKNIGKNLQVQTVMH